MITRNAQVNLEEVARFYPVVTVTGPRQSGKTTLCKMAFPDKTYVSLESPDHRHFALEDPRGFLRRHASGAIIDEVQRAPELTSYLQEMVDGEPLPGRFVLTGSRNFAVQEAVSQSLAGRTALIELMPLCLEEQRRFAASPQGRFDVIFAGGYPAIPDRNMDPVRWLGDYVTTYVERDVRQVTNIGDLVAFQTFMGLCAGRCGQLLNLSSLGADAGVSHNTARVWLSVLEAGYIVYRLPPWFGNVKKRLVKTPKLYFHDSGLLCHLLGIRSPDQLALHPLRGAIFENWVMGEIRKTLLNRGRRPQHHFYRDRGGLELDLYCPYSSSPVAIEIKSGETISSSYFKPFARLRQVLSPNPFDSVLIYGGDRQYDRSGVRIVSWFNASSVVDG